MCAQVKLRGLWFDTITHYIYRAFVYAIMPNTVFEDRMIIILLIEFMISVEIIECGTIGSVQNNSLSITH